MKYLCSIANRIVSVDAEYPLLISRIKKYQISSNQQPDFSISIPLSERDAFLHEHPEASLESIEYMLTGKQFFQKILQDHAFFLHASAVSVDGKAYLFSAPSGTGKSTHTSLYLKVFPQSFLINDDKPILRKEGDAFVVYGSPWSGKHDLSTNVGVPLQAICFLQRGDNEIRQLSTLESLKRIFSQTLLPKDRQEYDLFHQTVSSLLSQYVCYEAKVNMSKEAVQMTRETMLGEKQ